MSKLEINERPQNTIISETKIMMYNDYDPSFNLESVVELVNSPGQSYFQQIKFKNMFNY